MFSADVAGSNATEKISRPWLKIAILVVISLGLFFVSEQTSPANLFEPESIGWTLWASYAKDLVQPFAFYFFLCLGEQWLKTWGARAGLAFAVPALFEIVQAQYYRFSTAHYVGAFDPLDLLMYAISVGLAVVVERRIFADWFNFW